MTTHKTKMHTVRTSAIADALLVSLRTAVDLSREPVPALTVPTAPEQYAEVKAGLHRMAEQFVDPARAETRRTSVDDVAREFIDVLAQAGRKGLPFEHLGSALEYDDQLAAYRSRQDQYARSSNSRAQANADEVQFWVEDLLAVLRVRHVLGVEAVADAAEAGNKLLASSALDLVAREKLNSSGAQGLPILAAGRGLMLLRDAGAEAGALELADLEVLVALAGLELFPAALPGYGLGMDALSFTLDTSQVRVDARGAVLYREAQTAQGRSVLPHSVIAGVSKQAVKELQAGVDSRLDNVPHNFAEAGIGDSTLEQSRRYVQGNGGLNMLEFSKRMG
ncbi:hypothetical protein FAS41_27880 [Pseudomonas nicosulfuronedens]|uniref:Uncharacterized protein n=1 Tax=Pseudomonas nicosulfuronedens TaxID=2571105 RepID=A0A5R9QND8_9PSED|nr:hypothetical protein [Pseudomonas nicosulfuronedens]TLX70488.1 hypothetical protein FAS41_27880 [Pseudomonas nicosulfuronedens]